MKMKTLRKLRTQAPRVVRRREFDVSDDASDLDLPPEVVFDRITGPFGSRQPAPGGMDDET